MSTGFAKVGQAQLATGDFEGLLDGCLPRGTQVARRRFAHLPATRRTRPLKDTQAQAESLNGLIALRVKARRKSLGLSLEALARVSGVDMPTLHRLEQRRAGCPAVDLWRIAEALDVPISELCFPIDAPRGAFPRSFGLPGEPTDEYSGDTENLDPSKRPH